MEILTEVQTQGLVEYPAYIEVVWSDGHRKRTEKHIVNDGEDARRTLEYYKDLMEYYMYSPGS